MDRFMVREVRAVRVRVSLVRVGYIRIRDTKEVQAQRQMRLHKRGGQRRGSVAARASSAVG